MSAPPRVPRVAGLAIGGLIALLLGGLLGLGLYASIALLAAAFAMRR